MKSVTFKTELKKYGNQGEKTGWTYFEVPAKIAARIKPGIRKSFRVKGKIDNYPIAAVALIPIGEGNYIVAVNAMMRKGIRKQKGAEVNVTLEEDKNELPISEMLLTCLRDDPEANAYFNSLLPSHQRYFSKWIEGAKTEPTRIKRTGMVVNAMNNKWDYGQMLRMNKK